MRVQYAAIVCCLIESIYCMAPPESSAKFSLSSLYDAAMPVIHPIIAAGSDRCGMLKGLLGITYEQMLQKNKTNYQDISIDHITKNGNIKYNITATKRLARFISNATIIILIHGFLQNSDGWMVNALGPEYLKKPGFKILALDVRRVIKYEYFSASTHARFIGEMLGNFLGEIVESGQDPTKLVLIGHSLGAHIAGIAGKRLQQLTGKQASRITGLDPAGPCFSNVGLDARLDRGDAEYVEVVHTNAGVLGIKEPVGHKDFYPNGGMTQPGCLLATCDHTRAWELLAEAINAPEIFPARKCENRTLFNDGACARHEIAYMGSSAGTPGQYYFNTSAEKPFGLGQAGSGIN